VAAGTPGIVTRRPAAEADLLDIWFHIAGDDPAAADRLLDRIESALEMLADNPHAGRARPDIMPEIRSFPVGPYLLFHAASGNGVELVRVLHGARDIDSDFLV
jgi:toxin ParE1/3/4